MGMRGGTGICKLTWAGRGPLRGSSRLCLLVFLLHGFLQGARPSFITSPVVRPRQVQPRFQGSLGPRTGRAPAQAVRGRNFWFRCPRYSAPGPAPGWSRSRSFSSRQNLHPEERSEQEGGPQRVEDDDGAACIPRRQNCVPRRQNRVHLRQNHVPRRQNRVRMRPTATRGRPQGPETSAGESRA